MKRFSAAILLLLVFVNYCFAQNSRIPQTCRKILDKNFRIWRFARKPYHDHPQDMDNWEKIKFNNVIRGDWNGDKRQDYAVLIESGFDLLDDGRKLPRTVLVAFIKSSSGWNYYLLDTYGEDLTLEKKGTGLYDHNSGSGFTLANDAITSGYWGKAARTYVWHKNRFIYFQTND